MRELTDAQIREIRKYETIYREFPRYGLEHGVRREQVEEYLATLDPAWSLLDVGCGRGEVLEWAYDLGIQHVYGVEPVYLLRKPNVHCAVAWDLPFEDGIFDVVTCFDVMEHLLEDDAEPTLRELNRVARHQVALTISNRPDQWGVMAGVGTLHVNLKPYEEWDMLIREHIHGKVERRPGVEHLNEMWVITREVPDEPDGR